MRVAGIIVSLGNRIRITYNMQPISLVYQRW